MSLDETTMWLLQLAEGNQKVFEKIYYAYRTQLFGKILRQVKSTEIAQDILQDVFVKVWQNRAQIDASKNFKSYLYTIVQSAVYDYFRKIASDQAKSEQFVILSKGVYATDIEDSVSYKEMEQHLNEILEIIPDRCREVYVLCKLEGRSYDEVSKLLNISTATVNNHIVKATSIIKSHWSWTCCCIPILVISENWPLTHF